jgi:cofilin
MNAGITIADNCKIIFDQIKTEKKFRYVIYCIQNEATVEVEKIGGRNASYNDFLKDLMVENGAKKECRYGVFDFQYTKGLQGTSETVVEKLILVAWCPNEARIKKKMLYASTLDALKRSLHNHFQYIQATDYKEASYETVEAKINSMVRF